MAGNPQIATSPAVSPLGIDLTQMVVNNTQGPSFFVVSKSGGGTFTLETSLILEGWAAAWFVIAFPGLPLTITYYYDSMTGTGEGVLGGAGVALTLGAAHTSTLPRPGIFREVYHSAATRLSVLNSSLPAVGIYELTARVSIPWFFGNLSAFTTDLETSLEITP